jgi:hypothetical protein
VGESLKKETIEGNSFIYPADERHETNQFEDICSGEESSRECVKAAGSQYSLSRTLHKWIRGRL